MSRETETAKILVIVGPTASGKSELAVKLAKQFNGEVISADSRQVYKGLDIGAGKVPRDKISKSKFLISKQIPSTKSQTTLLPYFYKGIRHHLLDVASPRRTFTVAHYQRLALRAIQDILRRGKLPIICGGTGFYIDAVLHGWKLPEVKPNPKLRKRLEKLSADELFTKLRRIDPRRAETIDRHNKRRLIRALEIVVTTGNAVPPLATREVHSNVLENIRMNSSHILKIGLNVPPEELKKRIHKRLITRLRQGLINEVKKLHDPQIGGGISWKRLDDFGLEYRYVSRYLRGLINPSATAHGRSRGSKEIMIELLERESWHYAKRQMTWWKRDKDKTIRWIHGSRAAMDATRQFLAH